MGADPWSAADAFVGLYLATTVFQRIAEAGQGVRPTNPIVQLIRGHYTSRLENDLSFLGSRI